MKNINKLKRSIAKRVFYFSITMGDKRFSHLFSLQQLKIKDKFVCFSVNLCVFFLFGVVVVKSKEQKKKSEKNKENMNNMMQ